MPGLRNKVTAALRPSKSSMATDTTPPTPTLISSLPDLRVFLSSIPPPSTFYLDLEGKSLSRNRTLSLLTVLVLPTQATSIVDVQTLGESAFTTPGIGGNTLKAILEDAHTSKCFWDVRNDADALWAHHKVRLTGVTDVQLLENASRVCDKTYLRGLDKCVEKDLGLKFMEVHRWVKTKKEVQALMPNDIFARRPLDAKTVQYCVNDVVYLPALHNLYAKRITSEWLGKAIDKWLEKMEEDEVDARERDTFGDDYGDYYDYDDGPVSSKDAVGDDTFDSCWEK
ncbi:ribonuclease H-like domain-containing protein [Neurospora tetraspora]|uniref:Ribonuclease H-like domain-containing protein n=1 Tax=Neurospora tetraspora TaxID=94610 RepID=A0AAE0JNB2_9PEZI|nr:ribonuclease H-like domain-containing protein [Neurospora tetraspora]